LDGQPEAGWDMNNANIWCNSGSVRGEPSTVSL